MKPKHYLLLSIKSFSRKKINYLNIFLLSISIVLIIIAFSFSKTFTTYINNEINGNINHHILIFNKNNEFQDLNDIDEIDYISDFIYYRHYVKTDKDETINLIGLPYSHLNKISSENLEDNIINENVLICPSKFYLGNSPEVYDESFVKNIKNGKDMINKKIQINSLGYSEKYKIIDTYDVNRYSYGEYNICFTSENNIKKIFDSEINEMENECKMHSDNCDINVSDAKIAYVDDVNNIDKVIKELEAKNINVSKLINISTNEIHFFTSIIMGIAFIVLALSFSIMLISNNKFIQYSKKNNLIYKAIGYDNKTLIKLNYIESLLLMIVSIIISFIMILFTYILLQKVLFVTIETGMTLYISYHGILVSLFLILIVPLMSTYISLKNNSNSIIEELSDGEI